MASKSLIFSVDGADAPFTYKIEVLNPCVPITVSRGGVSAVNALTFSSGSPSETVVLSWNDPLCTQEFLGVVEVTATSATCNIVKTYNLTNICQGASVVLSSGLLNMGQQTIGSSINNMALGLFGYQWSVSQGAAIVGPANGSSIQISRSGEQATVTLTVTDSNGCKESGVIVLPAAGSAPTAANHHVIRGCDNAVTVPMIIDIVPLVADNDGDLNFAGVVINSNGTQGTATYDSGTKTFTYTGDVGAAGFDGFTFYILDNNGTPSNVATVTIQLDPCSQNPVGVADNATAECGETIYIPILSNDTSGIPLDPLTVQIVTEAIHGTHVVLSNGTIEYTPNANYSGPDLIRYKVADSNGNFSDITLVSITVESCCQSSAWLEITCEGNGDEGDPFRLVAVPIGTFEGAVITDVIEKSDDNVTYAVNDTEGTFNDCGTPLVTTFSPDIAVVTGAAITIGTPVLGVYPMEIEFNNTITLDTVNALQNFIAACPGDMIVFKNGATQFRFLKQGMSSILVTTTAVLFDYVILSGYGPCASSMNGDLAFTNAVVLDGTPQPLLEADPLQILCRNYYRPQHIYFRRTITRTGCPNIVVVLKVNYIGYPLPVCTQGGTFTVETIQGELDIIQTPTYSYDYDESGVTSVISITSDLGVTSAAYPLPAGLSDFVTFINSLLLGSGGGSFNAVYGNGRLICQIRHATIEFASLLTNAGSDNFTEI